MKIGLCLACCHFTFCIIFTLTTVGKDRFMELLTIHILQLVLFLKEFRPRGSTYSFFSILLSLSLRPVFEIVLQGN